MLNTNEPKTYILRNVVRCLKCGDIIESTHVHDFKPCSCGNISVDGGHDYLRRVGDYDTCEELSVNVDQPYWTSYNQETGQYFTIFPWEMTDEHIMNIIKDGYRAWFVILEAYKRKLIDKETAIKKLPMGEKQFKELN